MIRTAIFGGSFNPVHNGHVGLSRSILENGLAEEVWMMVSPRNPLKPQGDLLDERIRLELVCLAVENVPGVSASDFEFRLPRPSYTWKTLSALREKYADRSFSLVIGGDNWNVFHRWAHHEELLRDYPVIIYPRAGASVDESALPSGAQLLHAPLFPWSSTDIRQRLQQGLDVSAMLPENVRERIAAECLYRAT